MSLIPIKLCVIDDEKPIRQALIKALNRSPELEVVGEAESVSQGVKIILQTKPDAIFLDIKLREGDAFQLINILNREMSNIPPIIINTGYRDFTLAQKLFNEFKSFVIAILEKPFWENWAEKEAEIIDLIYAFKNRNHSTIPALQRIVIKSDYKSYILEHEEIMFFEVGSDSGIGKLIMMTIDKEIPINKSLSEIQKTLPPSFMRVSRYLIINLNHLDYYDHSDHVLYLKGLKRNFGVGNSYEPNLLSVLENNQ